MKLYDETLGAIEWSDNKGSSTFQYSTEALVGRIEPSPVIMPVQERIFETNRDHINFHNLPYLLSDSMPDFFGHIMMKEWLRQRKLSIGDINPVDRLSYVGESDGMGKIEYVYYRMAKEAGIDISESTLYEENNRFHFLTKRFDRTDKGEKIHMQSFGDLDRCSSIIH